MTQTLRPAPCRGFVNCLATREYQRRNDALVRLERAARRLETVPRRNHSERSALLGDAQVSASPEQHLALPVMWKDLSNLHVHHRQRTQRA